jgi:hypothetical protein
MNFSSSFSAWIARNLAGMILPERRARYPGGHARV